MDREFQGKRLLILGAYRSEIDIVRAAKRRGVYTVVTDNHTDWTQAPAKYEADEAWDVSWSDIDALREKCLEHKIDGCVAGFSERRVYYAKKLSEAMGFPFYADGADLDTIFNKRKFKAACRECGISVPREYSYGDKVDFPVIVKPADNGGSKGITVCRTDEELRTAYDKALSMSDSGEVVIEEYITGDEAVIYYYIQNGKATFVAMCDRYVHKNGGTVVQLPTAYIFPSRYTADCRDRIDSKISRLFERLGVRNGVMFLQAFVRDGETIIYEPGYRLNGARENCILSRVNGIDSVEMLIRHSLFGRMSNDDIEKKNDPLLHGKLACKLSPLIGEGRISRVTGLEEAGALPRVTDVIPNNVVGDTLTASDMGTLAQIAYRAFIIADSVEELRASIDKLHDTVVYYDENNEPMTSGEFDTSILDRYQRNS